MSDEQNPLPVGGPWPKAERISAREEVARWLDKFSDRIEAHEGHTMLRAAAALLRSADVRRSETPNEGSRETLGALRQALARIEQLNTDTDDLGDDPTVTRLKAVIAKVEAGDAPSRE